MTHSTHARFFDGKTAVPMAGPLTFGGSTLTLELETDAGPQLEAFGLHDIEEISRVAGQTRITLKASGSEGVSRLITFRDSSLHDAVCQRWAESAPGSVTRAALSFRIQATRRQIGIAAMAVPIPLAFLFWIFFDAYTFLPTSVDSRLGTLVMEHTLERLELCEDPAVEAAIEEMLLRLVPEGSPYTYKVRVVRDPTVNAITLPGGQVVVFSGLLERSESAEEIAGILAHEIGHVEQRHGIQQLIRGLGVSFGISMLIGTGYEELEAAETLSEVSSFLLFLKYSRGFEEKADRLAVSSLHSAGLGVGGLARFFERDPTDLEMGEAELTPATDATSAPGASPVPGGPGEEALSRSLAWFSTHPTSAERATYLHDMRAKERLESYRPLLSEDDWATVKGRCSGPE